METIKVSTTQKHKTSQGDALVTKGKLVLINIAKQRYNDSSVPERVVNNSNCFMRVEEFYKVYYEPIIISETEEIEKDGDIMYNKLDGKTIEFTKDLTDNLTHKSPTKYGYKRVLALPEHLSSKHLQTIIDGKLKDGDEVYVECEKHGNCKVCNNQGVYHCAHPEECGNAIEFTKIKLNSDNHITLHKVESKPITEEQMYLNMQYYYEYCNLKEYVTPQEWIANHKHF